MRFVSRCKSCAGLAALTRVIAIATSLRLTCKNCRLGQKTPIIAIAESGCASRRVARTARLGRENRRADPRRLNHRFGALRVAWRRIRAWSGNLSAAAAAVLIDAVTALQARTHRAIAWRGWRRLLAMRVFARAIVQADATRHKTLARRAGISVLAPQIAIIPARALAVFRGRREPTAPSQGLVLWSASLCARESHDARFARACGAFRPRALLAALEQAHCSAQDRRAPHACCGSGHQQTRPPAKRCRSACHLADALHDALAR